MMNSNSARFLRYNITKILPAVPEYLSEVVDCTQEGVLMLWSHLGDLPQGLEANEFKKPYSVVVLGHTLPMVQAYPLLATGTVRREVEETAERLAQTFSSFSILEFKGTFELGKNNPPGTMSVPGHVHYYEVLETWGVEVYSVDEESNFISS